MLELKTDRTDCAVYEADRVLWFEHRIALLRQRRFAELDPENLIEELESIVNARAGSWRVGSRYC